MNGTVVDTDMHAVNTAANIAIESKRKHYGTELVKQLTDEDIRQGYVRIKADPYRIADIYNVSGGAREQMLKKVLRWTDKGHREKDVLLEIICAAQRGIEMLEEDTLFK